MFGEGPACFISNDKEIDENIGKGILGSKYIGETQLLKFTEERFNAEIIILSF